MGFEDLKAAVAARAGLSKAQTGQAITALIEHLQTSLSQGDKINLPGSVSSKSRIALRARDATRKPVR